MKDLNKAILKNSMMRANGEEYTSVSESEEQALKISKPVQKEVVVRKNLNSFASSARTKSRSRSASSLGTYSRDSEEAYVSGMLKGYERGMKISSKASLDQIVSSSLLVSKKDSSSQVTDVDKQLVSTKNSSSQVPAIEVQLVSTRDSSSQVPQVKLEREDENIKAIDREKAGDGFPKQKLGIYRDEKNGGVLLFPGIVKRKSGEKMNYRSKFVPKKDSCSDIEEEYVNGSMNTIDEEKTDERNGGNLLFPGIVRSKSTREMLDRCLMRQESHLKKKAKVGSARSAKMHCMLQNNTKFRDSLSDIMERKRCESLSVTPEKSYTLMEPVERAELSPHFHDPSFHGKLEDMVKNMMLEKSEHRPNNTMQLSAISAVSPAQSDQTSINLGKILALSDDIKDMVDYWRTHSLVSLNSRSERSAEHSQENVQEISQEIIPIPVESKKSSMPDMPDMPYMPDLKTTGSEQFVLEERTDKKSDESSVSLDNMKFGETLDAIESEYASTYFNSTTRSTECMTSIEGSMTTIPTSLSDFTEDIINKNKPDQCSENRSVVLTNLDVGQVTKMATSAGNLVTYDIVCMTTPGLIVEKSWLYWKVVAIVALSSVERDGRVRVGDILFEIDGQSLRGVDKNVVRQILNTFHSGKVLHLTLLKRSHKPDNTGKRLLTTRSIARFGSKCQFLLDDEIRYSTRFKSALEAGGFKLYDQ